MTCISPVSYTHLDVYKRQAKYSLHFGEYYLNYKRKDFDALARSSASLYYTKEVQPSEIIEAALNHKTCLLYTSNLLH